MLGILAKAARKSPEVVIPGQWGKRIMWAGRWQGCFAAFVLPLVGVSSPDRGIQNERSTILSVADFVLALAAGEVVYAMVGPLSALPHQIEAAN